MWSDRFEKDRYVLISNIISERECVGLTQHLFSLKDKEQLINDKQCPLSFAIYGDSVFDALLEKLAKPLSLKLNMELLPTYSYARIYQPGEELKKHTDRESCEISGTLTLGHKKDTTIWPIYFETKDGVSVFFIPEGSIVMYHGMELVHWREPFNGEWQTQVFLHYVNANGPHKSYHYDRRPVLGIPTTGVKK